MDTIAAQPAPPRPSGCLLAWLTLVVAANALSLLSYVLILALDMLTTLGSLDIRPPLPMPLSIALAGVISLVAALLGLLGIVILASLLQDADYLRD